MVKEVKKITFGGVVSWIFGVFCILSVIGSFALSSYVAGIIWLIMALIVLPPTNRFYREKFNFELSKGIKISIVIVGLILVAMTTNTDEMTKTESSFTYTPTKSNEVTIVSKSFEDFAIICDTEATNLQKQDLFKRKFKDQYVEWSGEISSISEGNKVQVKHCPNTWTSDIIITMKSDQRDQLLQFREGDIITYRAKLTRLGDILGLSAIDGETIKIEEKREETPTEIIGNVMKEVEPETKKTQDFKFSSNSIVNTQNGISLALDDFKYEIKGENWGKLTELTITILNKGNNAFQPKILVFLYDEKDRKEEWFQTKAEIEFDMWQLEVGEHVTKKAIINIPFNDLDLPKKLELALLDAYEFGNKPIVVVEKEFLAK
ncbi:hypothetical protein HYW75_03210 [Candidatus Pacearchaeota archaeon]|nr:hypothetical protein [Candidatus Pacearchaeota archaeon]